MVYVDPYNRLYLLYWLPWLDEDEDEAIIWGGGGGVDTLWGGGVDTLDNRFVVIVLALRADELTLVVFVMVLFVLFWVLDVELVILDVELVILVDKFVELVVLFVNVVEFLFLAICAALIAASLCSSLLTATKGLVLFCDKGDRGVWVGLVNNELDAAPEVIPNRVAPTALLNPELEREDLLNLKRWEILSVLTWIRRKEEIKMRKKRTFIFDINLKLITTINKIYHNTI